jgi:hypothetical protein
VTNAAKHADGNPPTIALNYTDVGVELRVGNALPDATAVEHPDRLSIRARRPTSSSSSVGR